MSESPDILLEHSADGIREYDNPMPAWWLGIFYATIGFSVVFVPALWITQWSQEGQYEAELAAHEAEFKTAREAREAEAKRALAATGGGGSAQAGAAVFQKNCVACHGAQGQGGIGPDLRDATWIHGGTLPQIQQVVSQGVVEKGMLAWGPILGPEQVAHVAAYVHSLGGGL